jgi:capsule polysaccharide export protein KpsE/RkpR
MASSAQEIDMDEVAENIRKVVNKTAKCIKQGLSLTGFNMKEMCIHRSMMKEANKLINKIIENAAEHGFKCDYEALKEGKCKLIGSADQLEAGISILKKLKTF